MDHVQIFRIHTNDTLWAWKAAWNSAGNATYDGVRQNESLHGINRSLLEAVANPNMPVALGELAIHPPNLSSIFHEFLYISTASAV